MRTTLPDLLRLRSTIMIMIRENQENIRTVTEESLRKDYRAHLKSLQQEYDDCMEKVKNHYDLNNWNLSVALKQELAKLSDVQEKQAIVTKPQLPII